MAIWLQVAVAGQLILAAQAQSECAVPFGAPSSTAADRSWFSFFAKVDFLPYYYTYTQGFCRGSTWKHQPSLNTNAGAVNPRSNNEYGGGVWFCLKEDRTRVGCMAECETRSDCSAIDRPPIPNLEECCLFSGNSTGDGMSDRECYVKNSKHEFQNGDLLDTSVGVLPVPFLGYLTLMSRSTGVVATAEMGICPFWTWCGFIIKDCQGQVLYKISVETLPDIANDGTLLSGTAGLSYVIKGADGAYLGRSSHLTDGYDPIRLIDAQDQQIAMLITAAGFFRRTFLPLRWYVNTAVTREPATQVPLSDPRLLTVMVTYQFRNLGYFGIFWVLLFLVLVIAVYFYLRRRKYYGIGNGLRFGFRGLPYWTTSAEEQEEFLANEGGGCCTGRGKPTKKDTWASSLTLVSSPAGDTL